MKVMELTVKNPTGLHARPAANFCKMAGKLPCDAFIEKEGKRVNAKSVIAVLTLGVSTGDGIKVITDGKDEDAGLDSLVTYINELDE